MPSPFPGMDPYLEHPNNWPDIHVRVMTAIAESLTPQVRPAYYVLLEENVYLHEMADDSYRLFARPDATLAIGNQLGGEASSAAAATAPVIGRVPYAVDEERLPYATIVDRETREVVTVLVLLSHSNKHSGTDREQYLTKRRSLLKSQVHFVEIDLLRAGPRMPMENLPLCDYVALVSRWEVRPSVQLWPIRLRERLPVIPIPLKGPDAAAELNLQAILNRVYDAASYADYIYRRDLVPPLPTDDAQWADEVLKQASA